MKKVLSALLVLCVLFGGACSGTGTIKQDPAHWDSGSTDLSHQRLINILADKHDEYVNNDPTLDPDVKSAQLAEAMVVRMAFAMGDVKVAPIRTPANNFLTRLDTYVKSDPNLSPADAEAFKLNIAIVKRTIAESR